MTGMVAVIVVTVFSGECMVKVCINIHSYVHTSS